METFLPLLYLFALVCLASASFALMWSNIKSINDMNKPIRRYQHPELEGVRDGDELMVVKFKPELDAEGTVDLKFTPDEEFSDRYLRKSLNNRLHELDDEDEDDDDGDIVVRT